MIGVEAVGVHVPGGRISNYDRKAQFGITDHFIERKIGVRAVARKANEETATSLCVKAFETLENKTRLEKSRVQCAVLVTQNPDQPIPHASAVLHGKLGLPEACACFDISLGCSGYVYGLSLVTSFMAANRMSVGCLFTCDPYSIILDDNDKNTSLLFGDAATVTLISENPAYVAGKFTFGTIGRRSGELCLKSGKLYMDGSGIFSFAAEYVPRDVRELLRINSLGIESVDRFLFHQGSKYMIDTLRTTLALDAAKVPYDIDDYGNTVSSSIPILLEKELALLKCRTIVVSGFGVGLSWAGGVLRRSDTVQEVSK